MLTKRKATLEDLSGVEGKAELVNGEVVVMDHSGDDPSSAGLEIYVRLRRYAQSTGVGRAYADGIGYHVSLPNRESFSPDASYYTGPRTGMRFLEGAPDFAVEVRSENDYKPAAERKMADKRADYFAAGTQVVWDVDLLSSDTIRKYTATDPERPTIFRRGERADAEPVVPGWTLLVDDLFL